MSNTLTGLIPVIYEALDTVAREQVGFIPSVTIDAQASQAALNQTVRSPYTQAATLGDNTPAATVPTTGSQTVLYRDLTISKSKNAPIQWTGEEQKSVGMMYDTIVRDQFAQAFRALGNEVEKDLANTAYLGASRAAGSNGNTAFATASDFSDFAAVNRILDDNGAPIDSERHLILGSAAYQNLRGKQSSLFKANEAASEDLLRRGAIASVEGLMIHNSRWVQTPSVGAGNNATVTSNTVGDTALTCSGNTATILVGDVISIATDSNQYVVTAVSGAVVTIAAPGLLQAASSAAVTVKGSSVRNIGLHKSGIILAARSPLMPSGGDAASDLMEVTDPKSGLVYQVAMYRTYRQVHIEVGLAWGTLCVKPEFVALLLG
jgi:hypothetical protein